MVTMPNWETSVVMFIAMILGGALWAGILATAMNAVHARTEITRVKRFLDRLVWPMTKKEFSEMQLTWSAFTQKFYGDSGNFMSHEEMVEPSAEFKAKLEKRLGMQVTGEDIKHAAVVIRRHARNDALISKPS